MSLFDSSSSARIGSNFRRTDVTDWRGIYLGYTLETGSGTDAISATGGYLGKHDRFSDTTCDAAGVPIGKGNWLMSLFKRP
jgi:hypothetical protein